MTYAEIVLDENFILTELNEVKLTFKLRSLTFLYFTNLRTPGIKESALSDISPPTSLRQSRKRRDAKAKEEQEFNFCQKFKSLSQSDPGHTRTWRNFARTSLKTFLGCVHFRVARQAKRTNWATYDVSGESHIYVSTSTCSSLGAVFTESKQMFSCPHSGGTRKLRFWVVLPVFSNDTMQSSSQLNQWVSDSRELKNHKFFRPL